MASQHEPVELAVDLADTSPFGSRLSREQRARIAHEIGVLTQQLGVIASLVSETGGASAIEKRFRKLQKEEHFEVSLEGIAELSHKIATQRIPSDDKKRSATLYALIRLRIAQRVVELAREEAVPAALPEALALHRIEGDLDVPMALERIDDGVTPPGLTAQPFGNVAPIYKGPHHTFFLERVPNPADADAKFVETIKSAVTTHEEMKSFLASRRAFERHTALEWMESGKRGAMTMYLHVLGGLDIYATRIEGAPDFIDAQLCDFRSWYARNRVLIDPDLSFSDALVKGAEVYYGCTRVSKEEFLSGTQKPEAIMATTHVPGRGRRFHHFLPGNPVEFGAVIGRESIMTLEALRRAPLANGGPRFENLLPHAVAYLRYNGGDIRFLLILLRLLDTILAGKLKAKFTRDEQPAIDRLKRSLQDFTRSDKKDVWTVLRRFQNEPAYFLRTRTVANQFELRNAIAKDAQSLSLKLHGAHELKHMGELNTAGQMDTAEPLLRALNDLDLWGDVLRAMVSHAGKDDKPWLGHAGLSEVEDGIGRRALRFFYMHRGYEVGFAGVDLAR